MGGPLDGVRVLEIGGLGPAPFAGMMLADMGAEVVRVERADIEPLIDPAADVLNRGKRSVALDLKRPGAIDTVLAMAARAQILIEGYRPGVAERLGIGPDACWARNRSLVYGRMTGWGQTGPLAATAGHDITYLAVTGALHAIGDAGGPPQIPLNLLGDFGGGGMYLVTGVLAALREAERTGRGQVVDAAIVDGVAHLLAMIDGFVNAGAWVDRRGVNLLDGGAPYYAIYATADDRYMAVGALEPKFYRLLLAGLGLDDDPAAQDERAGWPDLRERIAAVFRARTRAEWVEAFAGQDACVAPVMSLLEASEHPHVRARGSISTTGGLLQPGAAPRFSGHDWSPPGAPPLPGQHTVEVLAEWGIDPSGPG